MNTMLPTTIDLDQAVERNERAAVERSASPRAASATDTWSHQARRAIGRWVMAIGARIAAEPRLDLAKPRRA